LSDDTTLCDFFLEHFQIEIKLENSLTPAPSSSAPKVSNLSAKGTVPKQALSTFSEDIRNIIEDESFKDLTISIGDEDLKAHKIVLAARSPFLAELFRNNPTLETLNLIDISKETFKIFLDYIYHDKMPEGNDNLTFVYVTAGKLKIEKLKQFIATKLCSQINAENAPDILLLSNKFDSVELRKRAFEKIQEMFPEKKLDEKFQFEPEKVKKLISLKRSMEMEYEKMLVGMDQSNI
jgi:hypothetical protein